MDTHVALRSAFSVQMLLGSANIPEIRRLLASGEPSAVAKLQGVELSLTTALSISLAHTEAREAKNITMASALNSLTHPFVRRCLDSLASSGEQLSADPFGAPALDVYRIGGKDDLLSQEWVLFYDRFRRSAAGGTTSAMFRAVAGVLGEIGDNVVWHAFKTEHSPCPALAAFHVSNDVAAFCVADSGQGFLQSLRRDSRWNHLATDDEALDAVVNKHATSREREREGGGFKNLFNSLLDFNGLVILRSGSCTYRLENTLTARNVTIKESLPIAGSSVTVIVSRAGKPVELPV